jgi:GNAT superfamily N-acetyltransferase
MVRIRLATPNDAPDIARTHCASWRTTYPGLVPESVIAQWADETAREKQWREIIETQAQEGQATWLAFDAMHPCLGFASASERTNTDVQVDGQLRALYLCKHAQRQGIGRALTHTAFAWMHAQGLRSVCVEVLKDNPAERFYRALGGEHVFTTVFEMGGHPLTEHIYVWETLDENLLADISRASAA